MLSFKKAFPKLMPSVLPSLTVMRTNPPLCNLPVRHLAYRPKIKLIFDRNGEFDLYHYEKGENMIRLLSRINVGFLCGNSVLLALELASPFFGYWHGVSLCLGISASFLYGGMLHYYSTRIIKNIYLKNDGEHVRVTYFNAFFMQKEKTMKIVDMGYLEPSRIYNLYLAKHKAEEKMYINFTKNMHKHPEYRAMLEKVFSGTNLVFPQATARREFKKR
ncbi:unnamed protein product [Moneuplotes crassus]|uniref:Transmembrane protein 186 n=2 Tax=Euplotes crassus TaxID=5936 RepID=A0AAD2D665_EUPCR|nr:unnamed protein product [Moneuplotes crassus]